MMGSSCSTQRRRHHDDNDGRQAATTALSGGRRDVASRHHHHHGCTSSIRRRGGRFRSSTLSRFCGGSQVRSEKEIFGVFALMMCACYVALSLFACSVNIDTTFTCAHSKISSLSIYLCIHLS
jgi:hypothetical protein